MSQPKFEEKLISQAIELGLSSQLKDAKSLNVQVQTSWLEILQGQIVDGVSITGADLTSSQGMSVQKLELQTDELSIDWFSTLLGNLKLSHPLTTRLRLVLSEADLNRAINAQDSLQWLLPVKLPGEDTTIGVNLLPPFKLALPADGKISIQGGLQLQGHDQTQTLEFATVLQHQGLDQPVLVEELRCRPGQGLSIDLAGAVIQRLRDLGERTHFHLQTLSLDLLNLQVLAGQIILEAQLHLQQIPGNLP